MIKILEKLKEIVSKKADNLSPTMNIDIVINPEKPKHTGLDALEMVNRLYQDYMKGWI